MDTNVAKVERKLVVALPGGDSFPATVILGNGDQPMSDPQLGWTGNPIPRWNGWIAAPLFDRAVVDEIAKVLQRDRDDGFEGALLSWDGDVAVLDDGEWPLRFEPDAAGRYAIGEYSWCWETDDDVPDIHDPRWPGYTGNGLATDDVLVAPPNAKVVS